MPLSGKPPPVTATVAWHTNGLRVVPAGQVGLGSWYRWAISRWRHFEGNGDVMSVFTSVSFWVRPLPIRWMKSPGFQRISRDDACHRG